MKTQIIGSAIRRLKKFTLQTIATDIRFEYTPFVSSQQAAQLLHTIHAKEGNSFQEFFYCLFLNRCNKVTGYYLASMGGVCGTVADPRLIVKVSALADCTSIILCHNHPSGSLKPSRADEDLTFKIKEACSFFDIRVLDHVIISEEGYYSFADEGIL